MTNLDFKSTPSNQWEAEWVIAARSIEGAGPFIAYGLRPEHFADRRLVFERTQRRSAAGLPITPGDLAHDLKDDPLFEAAGSVVFLIEAGRRAETACASEILAALIIDAWQRRGALSIYEALAAAREEAGTNLAGMTSRCCARQQIVTLLGWLAEIYAAAKRLIEPVPDQFAGEIGGVGKLIFFSPDELLELAQIHEEHARSNDQLGNLQLDASTTLVEDGDEIRSEHGPELIRSIHCR